MPTYRVYDFILSSVYPLHGYPKGVGDPEVTVERIPLSAREQPDGRKLVRPKDSEVVSDGGENSLGYVYDYLNFWVHNGTRIGIDPSPKCDETVIQAVVQGVLMAALLRQRGFLTLHGAGLVRDGKAIAILGNAGWGKSTLSSYLSDEGYIVLGDDIVAVDTSSDSHVRVVPGFPIVRLRPDAAEHLATGKDVSSDLYGKSRLHLAEDGYMSSFPLEAIYVLEQTPREENSIGQCSKLQALHHLIEHTRVTHLLWNGEYRRAHLKQCKQVIDCVPVRILQRKHGLEQLPEIARVIEADLEEELSSDFR